jgi:hypothetical protein
MEPFLVGRQAATFQGCLLVRQAGSYLPRMAPCQAGRQLPSKDGSLSGREGSLAGRQAATCQGGLLVRKAASSYIPANEGFPHAHAGSYLPAGGLLGR